MSFLYLPLNQNQFALDFTSNFGSAVTDEDIDLTAHPELVGQIYPGFDGETSVRNDFAIVFGFQVVHIGAVAVHVHSDGMPGAVDEVLAVTGVGDVVARRLVHFPSGDAVVSGQGVHNLFDARVARPGHNIEDLHMLRGRSADHARPGDVVINGVGGILLGEDVQEDKVALLDTG